MPVPGYESLPSSITEVTVLESSTVRSFNSLGLWDLVLHELHIEEAEGRECSRETGWTLVVWAGL